MSELLRELLHTQEPNAFTWKLGAREARGANALDLAQPGLVLCIEEQHHQVPRDVFFLWMREVGERLLRRLVETCSLDDEHIRLLATAVVLIGEARVLPFDASPDQDDDEDSADAAAMPSQLMMMLATLGPLSMICGPLPEPGTESIELIKELLTWAGKRHLRRRNYPHTTAALARRARELHGALAEYEAQGDKQAAEAAVAKEYQAQLRSLLSSWREQTEVVVL